MTRQTRAVYLQSGGRADTEALVTIASGENPDGTPFDTYTPTFGTVTTAVTATQFASVSARLVQIRAREGNSGNVSIGGSGVTTSAGYELAPGASTPWLQISNLNLLYYIGANTSDKADYIVLA